jgi:hypothetical protein
LARGSGQTVPCIHTIVGRGRTIESDDELLHQYLEKVFATWPVLVLVLALASGLMRPIFGLLFVTLLMVNARLDDKFDARRQVSGRIRTRHESKMLEKLTSQADAQLISNGRSIYNKGKDRRGPDERETTILTTKEVLCSNRNVSSKVVHMR